MKNRVLLVDDEANILSSYRRNLRGLVDFDLASSGQEAMDLMAQNTYSALVTDMQMPEMNGIELLKQSKSLYPNTVRLMLTGNADQRTAIDAVNIGDAFRFLNKPCSSELLVSAIRDAYTQYNLITSEKVLLNRTLKGVINILNEVLALVNPDAMEHTFSLRSHMTNLANELKLKHSWSFEPMIQLSQLGYIIFPSQSIHNAQSDQHFSEEERQLFEQHPCLSSDLISKIPRMENIARTILYQEKCFNGEGVPIDDVKGTDIPIGSRMLKVVLDYLRYLNIENQPEAAFSRLETQHQFYDPQILAAFKNTLSITFTEFQVSYKDLKVSMELGQDIKTVRGQLVAKKGQKVTESLQQIIHHSLHNNALNVGELVKVKEVEDHEQTSINS